MASKSYRLVPVANLTSSRFPLSGRHPQVDSSSALVRALRKFSLLGGKCPLLGMMLYFLCHTRADIQFAASRQYAVRIRGSHPILSTLLKRIGRYIKYCTLELATAGYHLSLTMTWVSRFEMFVDYADFPGRNG
jgi:hypothetical protein